MENNIIKLTENNDIDGIRKAIANGADVNIKDENGWTVLGRAIWWGRIEIVELLIEKGADVNIENNDALCSSTLMIAIYRQELKIVELLLEAGADVNFKNYRGETALDYAKEHGDQEIIELLTNLKPIKVKVKVIAPTSKVIQISTNPNINDCEFIALCEDGSIWSYSTARNENKRWTSILNNSTN